MLSCTTKKCQNWHFLVVMAWRHELNLLPLHYQKVPILAKIRNDMEEIKRDTMGISHTSRGISKHSINFICVHICLHIYGILKLFKINAMGHPKPIIFHMIYFFSLSTRISTVVHGLCEA